MTDEDYRVALRLAFVNIGQEPPHRNTIRALARQLVRFFEDF